MHSFLTLFALSLDTTDTNISLYYSNQFYMRYNNIYKTKHFYYRLSYLYNPGRIIYGGRKA